MGWVWLIVICIKVFVEILTLKMISIWLVPSACIALILFYCGTSVWLQIAIVVLVFFICLFCFQKYLLKFVAKHFNKFQLQNYVLLHPITENSFGTIVINGVPYNCKAENNIFINAGEIVEVVKFEDNIYIVKKCTK